MVGLWSLPLGGEGQREPCPNALSPPPFDDLDSFLLDPFPDFDPVKEWLVDPDHAPMPGDEALGVNPDGSDPKRMESLVPGKEFGAKGSNPYGSESRRGELRLEEDFLDLPIHEKLGKVSLVEAIVGDANANGTVADSIVDGGEEWGLHKISVEAGSGNDVVVGSSVNGGEERKGSKACMEVNKANGLMEVCTVSHSIKVARGSDAECSEAESAESEEDNDSLSDESSSSRSEEEEEDGTDDDDDDGDNDNGSKERRVDEVVEVEEGEIRDEDQDKAILGSDEDDEAVKGPIRSKHEVEVLPPVPKIEVSLESHHQTLPVGVVFSIVGARVIVEGSVKHNPLNEGSILWITETRAPLGLVDEIFGPVKNPYYVVRYNSDKELPVGINVGYAVSFVMEFAYHILNEKELYRKGYDASGENDEELTGEVEFSDDEKEAEYRRSLRQTKRGVNNMQHGNQEILFDKRRNSFKEVRIQKKMSPPSTRASIATVQPMSGPLRPMQAPPVTGNFGCSSSGSFGAGNDFWIAPTMIPAIPSVGQIGNCLSDLYQQLLQQQPNGTWAHGFLPQQQQNIGIGCPMNVFPSQPLGVNNYRQQYQNQMFNSFPNGMPCQQMFMPSLGIPANNPWLGGPVNPSVGAISVRPVGQVNSGPISNGCDNVAGPGASRICDGQSYGQSLQPFIHDSPRPSVRYNPGRSSFRGRMPRQRGGRHSFGRGGRLQNG